jgi:hypothetical protein
MSIVFRFWVMIIYCSVAIVVITGCGNAHTQYYFAAANLDDATKKPKVTFYRVTVNASSFGAKASLQQGFYDSNALHELFGEVRASAVPLAGGTDPKSQVASGVPKSGRNLGQNSPALTPASPPATGESPLVTTAGSYQLTYDFSAQGWTITNPERFTILYGANADEIANQIQLFAKNDKLGNQIGTLLKKSIETPKTAAKTPTSEAPKPQAPAPALSNPKLDRLKQKAAVAQKTASSLATKLETAANGLSEKSADRARGTLRAEAQDTLAALGSKVKLDDKDLDKAFQQAVDELKVLAGK